MHDRTIDGNGGMARPETLSEARANRRSGVPPATSVSGDSVSKIAGKRIPVDVDVGKRGEAERDGGGWNVPADELSRVCKPLSVYLVRLPDTIVRKDAAPSGNKAKKKIRFARWKHGSYRRGRDKRRRKKLPASGTDESHADENEENKISFSDAASLSGNSSVDSRRETSAPTDSKKSPMKIAAEKMEESGAVIETTVSGSRERDTSRLTASTEARIIEPPENTQILPLIDSTSIFSPRDDELGNYPTLRNTAKRKSAALFESSESKERQLSSGYKKSKGSLPPSKSNDDASSFESNLAGETSTDVAETRGVSEVNSMKTAVILVNRLDDSHSPTIEKWKDQMKIQIARSKSACSDPIGGLSPESSDNDDEPGPRNDEPKESSVTREANDLSTDIVMCNEDDSEEDDDEIIEFLSAKRRSRPSRVDSYSEMESNDEVVPSPVYESESEFEPSTPTRQLRDKKNNAVIIDDSSSEASSNRTRRRPRTRASCVGDRDTEQRSAKKRDSSSTRGQPRAAMDTSEDERFTPDPVSTSRRTRSRRSSFSHGWNDRHDESTSVAQDRTQNMDVDEDDVINRNVDEENHVTLDPITVSDCSYSLAIQSSELEENESENRLARKKLTAMKDAMVILTRLEDFNYFSASNGYSNENEGDADSNEDESGSGSVGTTCRSGDPLEINDSDGSRARVSSSLLDSARRKRIPEAICGREVEKTIGENEEATRSSQHSIESEYEMTLMVEDRCSQETVESEVELSLFVDEREKSPEERSNRALSADEGILTDSNGSNERASRTSAAESPQDFEEHRSRCDCQENESVDRHVECKNTSAVHKCARCGGTFKNYALLEQHEASKASCNFTTRCNTCKANFPILLDSLKHRMTCADRCSKNKPRNSLDEATNEETISECRSSDAATPSQQPRSRDKKAAKQGEKNPPSKARAKMRCRVDDLTCNVCSTSFTTKAELSEHLYKHSSGELQEAFRIAKAKAMAGGQRDESSEENNEANLRGDLDRDTSRTSRSIVDSSSEAASNPRYNGENPGLAVSRADTEGIFVPTTRGDTSSLVTTAPAVVCPCHRDNDKVSLGKTGLQIEIVLLCKYCQVLFRRRECLEIHYRTSSSCAIDRTRERWPRLFCANCRLILNNWAEMGQHLEFHARQNSERTIRFVCNICRVVFVGFGTLLFSHWNCHSKDTIFVASRYNFPKFSVQPKNGTEKLPAGARPDENYIFVAEHVCSRCKKPFSMRRDLDSHRTSSECRGRKKPPQVESSTEETLTNGVSLACDVCRVAFEDQEGLNHHGGGKHGNRYIYIYDDGTVSGKVANEVFKCTGCLATMPTVSAIEEHWKKRHDPRNTTKKNDERVTSSGSRGIADEPPIITIDEGNNGNVRILSDVPAAETPLLISVPSFISSAELNQALDISQPAELRRVLEAAASSNRAEKPVTQARAVEDQSANAIVSNTPTDPPPPIVNERRNKTSDKSVSGSEVVTDNAESATTLSSRDDRRASREGHVDSSNTETTATDPTAPSAGKSTLENRSERTSKQSATIEDKENKGKDESPSKSAGGRAIGVTASTAAPEIIDVVDEDTERRATNDKASTGDFANAKMNIGRLRDCRKSNVPRSQPANVSSTRNAAISGGPPEVSSGSDTGSARKRAVGSSERSKVMHAAALRASRSSVEEDRWKWVNSRAASANASDASATRKQGFLRVKDLSELQAVKTHACSTCNAAFESEKALSEHRRLCTCGGGSFARRERQYPRGIEAALVLPDTAERPKTPATGPAIINAPALPPPPSIQPISYLTRDTIGIISSQGSQIAGQCSAGFINGRTSSSLIVSSHNLASFPTIGRQQHSGNATGTVSNLVQGSSNGFFHNTATDTVSLASDLSSDPIQNNTEGPPQLVISSVQSIALRDPIQEFGDARIAAAATAAAVASFGYHVLPPVVAAPSSQHPKQTDNLAAQRVSSSNYLPSSICTNNSQLMREPENPGRFRCNICHTFRSDDIDALNNHVTKHYTGWKSSSVGTNSHQPTTVAMITSASSIPNISTLDIRTGTPQRAIASKDNAGADVNRCRSGNSSGFKSWTVKDTPQGPVFVTPAINSTAGRQAYSSLYRSNDRSILRQSASSSSSSSTNNSTLNGQIVYLCKICKSALYKNYPPLRNHVLLVHGITDFGLLSIDSIAQKSYHCTQCPNTTALFDCEKEYRQHVDTIHSQACPSCRRVFTNFLTLRHHLEQCRISSSSGRNSHGDC